MPRTRTNLPAPRHVPAPRFVAPGHYVIDSFTRTLVAYHLTQNEYGVWACSCPSREGPYNCKHSRWLEKWLLKQRRAEYRMALYGTPTKPTRPARRLELTDLFTA